MCEISGRGIVPLLKCNGESLIDIFHLFLAQLCFAMLSVIPPMKGKFEQAVEEYTSCFQEKSLLTSAFGAFVLGVGMALSGSVSVTSNK